MDKWDPNIDDIIDATMDNMFIRTKKNGIVKCDGCGIELDSQGEGFFTFAGNVYVGLQGGVIGNNLDHGVLKRIFIYCTKCTRRIMFSIDRKKINIVELLSTFSEGKIFGIDEIYEYNLSDITINNNGMDIPIVEKMPDGNLIFYKNNFDKYRSKIEKQYQLRNLE